VAVAADFRHLNYRSWRAQFVTNFFLIVKLAELAAKVVDV
jgi:hypothetical protein